MKVRLLGVNIDAVTRTEAGKILAGFMAEGRGHRVFTPNPEMLVQASCDADFRATLNSADLAIPDGVGLLWAARRTGQRLAERVTGTDLMQDLAGLAAEKGWSVFLLGGGPGVAAQAAAVLRRKHPSLRIVGQAGGGRVSRDPATGRLDIEAAALGLLKSAGPDIIFVAFGHGTQETWIGQHLAELPSVRIAMGIGGAFDFIAGKARRAPVFLRKIGLEWLWRLITEPRRWKRIWRAVIVFPFLVITAKR